MSARFSGSRGLCSFNQAELARFAARSPRQKIPFLTPVSETGFDDCVGSRQFGPDGLHQPVFGNLAVKTCEQKGRFCGRFSRFHLATSRSLGGNFGLWVDFGAPVSGPKNPVPGGGVRARQEFAFRGRRVKLNALSP